MQVQRVGSPRRVAATLITTLALVALLSASAGAIVNLSAPGDNATGPRIGIDGAGNTTVAWGLFDLNPWATGIATRGSTSPDFSDPSHLVTTKSALSDLAVGPRGDVAIVWLDANTFGASVHVSIRRPGATTFASYQLTHSAANDESLSPHVAISAGGLIAVTWTQITHGSPATEAIDEAQLPADTILFSSTLAVSTPRVPADTDDVSAVATDPTGAVTVAWARFDGTRHVLQAARRAAGGSTFSTPQDLSADGSAGSGDGTATVPTVAADALGGATVAWAQEGWNGAVGQAVQSARLLPGHTQFSATQTFDPGIVGASTEEPSVAVDVHGVAYVAMVLAFSSDVSDSNGVESSPSRVQVATGAASAATFATPATISTQADSSSHSADEPTVQIGPTGTAAIVYRYLGGGGGSAQLVTRAAGETSYATPRSIAAYLPQFAFDPDGDVTVVWSTGGIVQAEELDTTAPLIDGLDVPATAFAGQPVAMSATAHDRLSSLQPIAWDFGDDALAAGGSVTHTYAAPGIYTVAIAATDVADNRRTATAEITVLPAPAGTAGAGTLGGGAAAANDLLAALRAKTLKTKLIGATLAPNRVRPEARGAPLVAKLRGKRGATLKVISTVKGKLTVTVQRRSGRRWKSVGSATKTIAAGLTTTVLSGRVKSKALKPGSYRLSLTLIDASKHRTAAKTLPFKVVK